MRSTMIRFLLLFTLAAGVHSSVIEKGYTTLSEVELASIVSARLADSHRTSLPAVADAARVLSDLSKHSETLCKRSVDVINKGNAAVEETAAAVYLAARLRCLDAGAATAADKLLWSKFPVAGTVTEVRNLVQADRALHDTYGLPSLAKENVQRVIQFLSDATASSGKVRSKSGAAVSIESTGAAYQIIADLSSIATVKSGSEAAEAIEKVISKAPQVLAGATAEGLFATGDSDGIAAVAAVLEGVTVLKQDAGALDKIQHLATYVAKFSTVGSAEEAQNLLIAKRALQKLNVAGIVFNVRNPSIKLDSQDTIQIDVSDTSGNSIDLSDFEAELLDQFGKSISVPVSAAAGHLTVKVLDQVSQGGAYTIQLSDGSDALGTFVVSVVEPASFGAVEIAVEKQDGTTISTDAVEYPQSLAKGIVATGGSSIQVSLDEPTSQTVLLLKCGASGETVAVPFKSTDSTPAAVVDLKILAAHFDSQCSRFTLAASQSGSEWVLATLVAPEKRAMPSQSWRQDYAPRPIISHQFRKPDKRPASVISVAFAGTALVPLALLLVGLQHIKVNLKDFPTSGTYAVSALIFHGGLGGLALLYTAFWVQLNLLETLPILSFLAVLLSVSGYVLLSHRSAMRRKKA